MCIVADRLGTERAILVAAAEPPGNNRADLYAVAEIPATYLVRPVQEVVEIPVGGTHQLVNLRPLKPAAFENDFCVFGDDIIHIDRT